MLKFTMKSSATRSDVVTALKHELHRRIQLVEAGRHRAKTKVAQAEVDGQIHALTGMLQVLENLEFV